MSDVYDWAKGAWNDAPGWAKDGAALFASGGLVDSSGKVTPVGLGPGGAATGAAAGAAGVSVPGIDITPEAAAGGPQISGAYANPGGAASPTPSIAGPEVMAPGAGNTGLDMMTPGAMEAFQSSNSGAFTAPTQSGQTVQGYQPELMGPGAAERYASQVAGRYGQGTPASSQYASEAYKTFNANRPDLALDSGMGSYYDNAGRIASEKIKREMAARGAYGSSASGDMVSEALTNLAADQARSEADYRLRRADTIRGFGETAGNLARGADISSNAASQNELDWMMGLGDQAESGQRAATDRMNTGFRGASEADAAWLRQLESGARTADMAQGAQRQRGQDFFNNSYLMGNALSGMVGDASEGMFGADAGLLDASMGMELGLGAEALNQDYKRSDQINSDARYITDLMMARGTGGGGGGGGK